MGSWHGCIMMGAMEFAGIFEGVFTHLHGLRLPLVKANKHESPEGGWSLMLKGLLNGGALWDLLLGRAVVEVPLALAWLNDTKLNKKFLELSKVSFQIQGTFPCQFLVKRMGHISETCKRLCCLFAWVA